MADTVLVTGGAGPVGSECCRVFAENGYDVISVDNYTRGDLFGDEGDTETSRDAYLTDDRIDHRELDIRDDEVADIAAEVDAVVHNAAQPSHPRSIDIRIEGFEITSVRR